MTRHPMEHYQSRIIALAVIGILITGLLVGLSTAVPRYLAARGSLEQLNALNAESQRDAVDHLMLRYRGLALQTASRSEIRRRLQQYADSELTFADLSRYTAPRLDDALGSITDLAGARRLGPGGETVFERGRLGPLLPALPTEPGLRLDIVGDDGNIITQATAPIRTPDGRLVGADQLFFRSDALARLLHDTYRFGAGSRLFIQLHEHNPTHLLAGDGQQLSLLPLPETMASQLATPHGDNGMFRIEDAHGQQVVFHARLATLNASLLVQMPAARLYAPASQQLPWTVLTILLMMVLGALITARAMRPITRQLLRQTRQLEESGAELRLAASVFESAQEAIAITDAQCRILRVNGAFSEISGHEPNRVLGHFLYDLFDTRHRNEHLLDDVFRQLQQNDVWQGEIWYRRPGNEPLPTLQTISAVRDADARILRLIHIFNDISAHKDSEARMQRLASYDALTGLANRATLYHRLDAALADAPGNGSRYAILFIDLDHFKPVNDRFGHHVGDELLKAVAKRMTHILREDDLIGRIGGDEFLVLLNGHAPAEYAATVAQKLIARVSEPFHLGGQTLRIGASVGIALYPEDGTDSQCLLEQADAAMYEAKRSGRGGYCFAGTESRSAQ